MAVADTERPLSFLPTIKCSTCNDEIQISHLADHVCATTPSINDEPASPPKLDRAATFGGSRSNNALPGQLRPGRMPPPRRIDPSAANQPFGVQNMLSPMSNYSDSNSLTPVSPNPGKPPFKMNRSATSPMPRLMGPPSPDLPGNMDCAFPPFPTARSATPTSGRINKERSEQKYNHRYAEPDPMYAPLSPRIDGGESVLKKMDTIAPGPFDGRAGDRRPSTSNGKMPPAVESSAFGHRRTTTQGSIKSNGAASDSRISIASNRSRTSTFSNGSVGLPSHPKLGAGPLGAMARPPRPAQSEGIDAFLNRLQKETTQPPQLGQDSRSRTFPLRKESGDAIEAAPRLRRPSEPTDSARRPTFIDPTRPAPSSTNMFPIRSASRSGSRFGGKSDEPVPPMPSMPTYGKERPQKPLHTPSDSGLSDDSTSSSGFRSGASSRSSPPASDASGASRRPSKSGRADFMDEPVQRVASPESYADPAVSRPSDNRDKPMGYNRGRAPEPLLQAPPIAFADAPESPLDPAIQKGLLYQRRPSLPRATNGDNISQSPPADAPRKETRDPPARRPTTASKGSCRGCGDSIVGKSVKDSSGRLTGRYHKQCFVCRTCRSPFPSADFYVFENFPYCEQHYHKLNGSMCKTCNRGIEGQYLETDQRQKFHPKCFTCVTCRVVLRDDYYEVGGKPYCDRHAYHASQQGNSLGPGGNRSRNMQKRSTRLMMMV